MKPKMKYIVILSVLSLCLINFFAYRSIIKISGSMISFIRSFDLAYVTPINYLDLIRVQSRKPFFEESSKNQLQDLISDKSNDFVLAVFEKDDVKIKALMDPAAKYIRAKNGASFIRYIENGIHVEGYMATDKKLVRTKHRWCVLEDDNTITCSMEIYTEGSKSPDIWYLHFKRIQNDWKLYMLENDI